MPNTMRFREYDELTGLDPQDLQDLKDFALENQADQQGKPRQVLRCKKGKLYAQNYVGIIQTRQGAVLEILPKVDFPRGGGDQASAARDEQRHPSGLPGHPPRRGDQASAAENEPLHAQTQQTFLAMLRDYRGLKSAAHVHQASIRALHHFNMLEVFVHLFLTDLALLTQRGLARHYQAQEDNLPCLRGRILFPQHIRENAANRARFYVGYDEFTADRPVNRLIHSALHRLSGIARQPRNQQLLHQLRICFADIPRSTRLESDWDKHQVDRSMPHYDAVMQWVGLFLFKHGLATFAGRHVNQALLFPMEEVFEDFVTASFRRWQKRFAVREQGPRKYLTTHKGREAFAMKPDISLMNGKNDVAFILDAKWKRLNEWEGAPKYGISQNDMYQLFAYGKKYECGKVALIYPRTAKFQESLDYRFDEELSLTCFPFDVTEPEQSVKKIMAGLQSEQSQVRPDAA